MTIGFFLVNNGSLDAALGVTCAEALIDSAKRTMPTVPVVQFTDETTEAVEGVDEVRRKPAEPMAVLRMRHHASVEGDWLFVDSDVIFQREVQHVFADRFDVAITTRNWSHLKPAVGFSERMPFNVGVVFSRCRPFWKRVLERVTAMPDDAQQWMGDQQAVCDVVADRKLRFHVKFLKGSKYNLPPSMEDGNALSAELERKANIIHYKGTERKALLMERLRSEAGCASD